VRLLASSIQVVPDDHPFEKWANIPRERERLYALINGTKAQGVIVLSGDRHLAEVSLDTKAVGYPLYDATSSGFNQAAQKWREPEKNTKRLASMPYGNNFGLVTIDWGDDPRVHVQIRDEEGDATCGFKVRLSTLRGTLAEQPKLPAGVLNPAEAARKVGEKVTVQFAVGSAGGQTNLYLNSEKDYRARGNFAIVLTPDARKGKWARAAADTFTGKTVRATGTVKLNKDAPQLEIADEKDLEVAE
jgi:alkaline phosphatase D